VASFIESLPARVRAFIAVRMSEPVERSLAEFIEVQRTARDGIQWVRRANLHVTLKFLGPEVEPWKLAPLVEMLERVARATAPFEVATRGVGGFPDLMRPRVIWAGLYSEPLDALAREVEEAAVRCGFERERRGWSGHLTIGRVRNPRHARATLHALERERERNFGLSRISAMTLMRSHLAPEGSTYEPLASFTFAAQ
jgi:RNA 2',3'-cyclic 3'-phosphodiesterase